MIVEPRVKLIASTCIEVDDNMQDDALSKRMDPAADAEIQQVAGMIRDELHEVAPNIFPKEVDE